MSKFRLPGEAQKIDRIMEHVFFSFLFFSFLLFLKIILLYSFLFLFLFLFLFCCFSLFFLLQISYPLFSSPLPFLSHLLSLPKKNSLQKDIALKAQQHFPTKMWPICSLLVLLCLILICIIRILRFGELGEKERRGRENERGREIGRKIEK